MTHVLEIHEQAVEWTIHHGDDCPSEEDDLGIGGLPPVTRYCCSVADVVAEIGLDGVALPDEYEQPQHPTPAWHALPEGRYELHLESSHTPSTVNGPEEWDAWLEVGERL